MQAAVAHRRRAEEQQRLDHTLVMLRVTIDRAEQPHWGQV
ncbi:hypothetical protein STVIR_7701 [Streptomyces viridochromogenes Tue57]|uniref:Uncharacterized protein n=1 Tax=Streptomyces viridochromogenes Tue57 TaxID=1160705 RepID=L8P7M8_STRVR|nr:hypothetical protein STVIR_7701 [Streptomyces viridochromogenes Tue57]